MLKKIMIFIIISMLWLGTSAYAEYDVYELGTYYQFGKYDATPILWRCVSTNDENGILMVSDKILCFKSANDGDNTDKTKDKQLRYGSNFWEESTIRMWLNSTSNNVKWSGYQPDYENLYIASSGYDINYPYADESGFLCDANFAPSEKSVLKTVTQWQALPADKIDLATNEYKTPYITSFYITAGHGEVKTMGNVGLAELKDSYKGAMYRISDTMFLLNEPQVYAVLTTLGTVGAKALESPIGNSGQVLGFMHNADGCYDYFLRSPQWNNEKRFHAICQNTSLIAADSVAELGIRPAFYLNEATAQIKSGTGTENDPYVLDGQEQTETAVFTNAGEINFDVAPITENDRTLVGMRAVFEALGADVEWRQDSQTAVAVKDDITIVLQIDNDRMTKNGKEIQLDVPARIVNDRTMVPLRTVSEALDARVEWIEDLNRVVIDVKPEWVESDWYPDWYKRALIAGGYTAE